MSDHTDTPDDPLDADVRATDAALDRLFAPVRPDPALEDRLVRSLRSADATPRRPFTWRRHPLAWGVAASVGLGAVGAAVSSQLGDGLPLPWETTVGRETARNSKISANDDSDGTYTGDVSDLKSVLPPVTGANGENTWSDIRRKSPVPRYDTPSSGAAASLPFDDKPSGWEVNGNPAGRPDDEARAKFGSYFANPDGYNRPLAWSFSPNAHRYGETDRQKATSDLPAVGEAEKSFKEALSQKSSEAVALAETPSAGRGLIVRATGRPVVAPAFPKELFAAVQPGVDAPPPAAATANRKVILRSGDIEFEIESFDAAVAAVTKLVTAIDGAFVATVNSEKLPNGKVKGIVAVRVPPEKLDGLVLDLRRDLGKGGELKGQRIGSQDVTKQYTDLESRLKAARTMETRLLAIIKDGKGEIKQLLDAEKELGVWRTKIEEMEGEKRYFDNLASLSTLTITLAEREIKAAAGVTESEVVQTGVEVEDVEQAFRDALAAVAAANGRVTKSDLKQVSSGQFNATLNFEVAPDVAGPVRDRLRQLGRVARLEITRQTVADTGTVTKDAKVKKGDTQFQVQLYNVTAMQPRETITLRVATPDVPAGFRTVKEAVEKAKGRVFVAALSVGDKAPTTAQLDFEVKRGEEAAVQTAVAAAGEVVARDTARVAEADGVTDTKVLVRMQLLAPHQLEPREKIALAVETADVDAAGAVLTNAVKDAGGRVADSGTVTDRGTGKVTARYVCDVPLAAAAGIAERAKAAGAVKVNQAARNNAAPDGRYATARLDVTFTTPDRIVAPDDGFAPQVKKGLSYSVSALFVSLSWLVFGLLVVLPWAVVVYGGYRLVRRLTRSRKE